MVDFSKLRAEKRQVSPINPIDIFRRLPKPQGINDLYISQAQVLEEWYKRRTEQDLVVKLHTGGGKTLVGLLIAQSILHETKQPVAYLSPTVQLVQQTYSKAAEYSIPAVLYEKGQEFSEDFLGAKKILIGTYQALFNGRSRFGGIGGKELVSLAGVILDDAHVSFNTIRDSFTLNVLKKRDAESYYHLSNIFRNDFNNIGKLGTFDDIVNGLEGSVLEVPYWGWYNRSDQIREYLRERADDYKFEWPFLRDAFNYCHCLISKDAFVITPIFPLVDLIPSFTQCKRRIFMSATISDDSDIIRTFGANHESVAKPISSNSLAGVSERMILAPELMQLSNVDIPNMLHGLVQQASKIAGAVILVPSASSAQSWQKVAKFADSPELVGEYVKMLQNGESWGPFIFANRYDGIDLPDKACRLLILSDIPRGASEYDSYRINTFLEGATFNNTLAQRIEQGIGRGSRGAGDFCIVIIVGKKLVSWLSQEKNTRFLTSSTYAQIEMGIEISRNINTKHDLIETMNRCIRRDKEWVEYHAETLADLDNFREINTDELTLADTERRVYRLWRDNYHDKAISKLNKYINELAKNLDEKNKGWLLQLAARIAYHWDRKDLAQNFQQNAYAYNNRLLRPQLTVDYVPIVQPGEQAEAIVAKIKNFHIRLGYIAEFEDAITHLVPEASANQFEEALERIGAMIGYSTQRPDNLYRKGPDVLWLLNDKVGLVIEAKSRKDPSNALTKNQHGQLLNAVEWFKKEYPRYSYVPISVHPNINATNSTVINETKALTYAKLQELISDVRKLLSGLCNSAVKDDELIIHCEQALAASHLKPSSLINHYFIPFENYRE